MRGDRRLLYGGASMITGALAVIVAASAAPGAAAAGPVSKTPASGTPQLAVYNGRTADQVRQLVQCGGTMYAVRSWNPDATGKVNSVAFNGSDCSIAYLGGNFSSVHGAAAKYFAAVSTS